MEFDLDTSEMQDQMAKLRVLKLVSPKLFTKTVNSTASSMKTYTGTAVSKKYTIQKSYAKGKLNVQRIGKGLGGAGVISRHRPTFINRFEHTPNVSPGRKGGAYVHGKVLNRSGIHPIDGAFIAPVKNKGGENVTTGVFSRTGKLNGKGRQIIKGEYAPGVTSMMNNPEVVDEVMTKTEMRFDKVIDQNLKKAIKEAIL